jgi:hypothetical protein
VEAGLLEAVDVLSLSEAQMAEILTAMEGLDPGDRDALDQVSEMLGGAYDSGVLRCVMAALYPRGEPFVV